MAQENGKHIKSYDFLIGAVSQMVVDGNNTTRYVHIQNRGADDIRVGVNQPAVNNAGLLIPGTTKTGGIPVSWEIDTGCAVDLYLIRDTLAAGD